MIEFHPETGSTNADLAKRLRAGEALTEGFWLIADRQTGGRGRQGRVWSDGAGNFMGSTLVRPGPGDPPPQTLAFVAGLAVYRSVEPHRAGGALRLKWPNDVLLGGAKLAGTLLEAEGRAVVIGIGVNLAGAPDIPDRPATALPAPVGRNAFTLQLADAFADELARWRRDGLGPLLARWAEVAHPEGEALAVHEADGTRVSGAYAGLGADGALLLRLADGTTRAIHAGDVLLEGR